MKGSSADVLDRCLEQEGVESLFGVPGGQLLALYEAIHRSGRRLKAVLVKNEEEVNDDDDDDDDDGIPRVSRAFAI